MKNIVIVMLLLLSPEFVNSQSIPEVKPGKFIEEVVTITEFGGCYVAFQYRDSLGKTWNAVAENHLLFVELTNKLHFDKAQYISYVTRHVSANLPLDFDSVGRLNARFFRNRRKYQRLRAMDQDEILNAVSLLENHPKKSRFSEAEIISAAFYAGLALHHKRTQLRVKFKVKEIY